LLIAQWFSQGVALDISSSASITKLYFFVHRAVISTRLLSLYPALPQAEIEKLKKINKLVTINI
jgi:hypothetical protein